MKVYKKDKRITLITVLVIILLILAGITVVQVYKGKLFNKKEAINNIEFSYDKKEIASNKLQILIKIKDIENGISQVEFPDGDVLKCNDRNQIGIDYTIDIGVEYIFKIKLNNGEIKEEKIYEEQVLEIWNLEDLQKFAKTVNNGLPYEGKTVKLKSDLDLTDINYEPIGWVNEDWPEFKGIFDGENHTISNMNINIGKDKNVENYGGVGFISYLQGTLKNLNFKQPYIYSGVDNTGIAVGYLAGGSVENVHVLNGVIESDCSYIGGICGLLKEGVVKECSNYANVTSSGNFVGGICGYAKGKNENKNINNNLILYCKNLGNIQATKYSGGIAWCDDWTNYNS